MADEATGDFPYYDLGPATSEALDLDAIEQRAIAAGAYGWWEPADQVDVAAALRGAFLGHTQTMADADARHIIGMDPDTTLALVDALARVSREAEALLAKVAAVEALATKFEGWPSGPSYAVTAKAIRAALATTGEGE